jgi:hypothetical protein
VFRSELKKARPRDDPSSKAESRLQPVVRRVKVRARSPWTTAAVGLIVLVLIPHAPLLLGRAAPMWDGVDFFGPYYMLVGDFARHGTFLLWNPFTLGGSPDYLEPQLGSFSPLVVSFGLIFGGTRLAFELYWLAIWLFGGLGVVALARHLGAPPWGGFLSAVAFAFSGFYTGNAQNAAMLYSFSFLPWLVWRVDVAISERTLRSAVEAGALFGLSGLGGYPALVFLNGCFVLLWSLGRVVWSDEPRSAGAAYLFKRIATLHVIIVLIGAAVMSPTYVPFFIEGPDVSDRAGPMKRDDAVANDALHPAAALTLSSPALWQADIFEYTDISMRSLYVGALVLASAAFALSKRRNAAFRRWLLFLALLFLACAMGRALPLRDWLYDWVPPTRYFRHAALFRGYTIFALVVLALLGTRDLATTIRTQDREAWRRFTLTVGCMAALALAGYTSAIAFIREAAPVLHTSSHWHTYGTWLLMCVVAAVGLPRNGRRWRQIAPVAFIVLAIADALSASRLARPTMYNPEPDSWRALDDLHGAETDLTTRGLMRDVGDGSNHAFVSKTPTMRGYSGLAGRLVRRYAEDDALVESVTGPNRLWFSTSVGIVDRSEDCYEVFRDRAAKLPAPPLVIHPQPLVTGGPPGSQITETCEAVVPSLPSAMRVDSFTVWTYSPTRLRFRVDVPAPGWLLVTDTWSRRWRVTVNDRESTAIRANFAFRAVQVSQGTNFVDFRYDAIGFPWLLMLSWGLLMSIGVWNTAATKSGLT